MSRIQTQFGIVALIDALGVSSYSIEDSKTFLSKKQLLLNFIETHKGILNSKHKDKRLTKLNKPNVFTFGDTIIFLWELEKKDEYHFATVIVADWLRPFIYLGLKRNLYFRGAISIGEYVHDNKTTVIGPAIADAASWYEQSEWFGIAATPSFNFYLERVEKVIDKVDNIDFFKSYVKYPVQCKGGIYNLFSISWPFEFFNKTSTTTDEAHYSFVKYLYPNQVNSKFYMPKGTENKYINSKEFFDFYCREFGELLPDNKITIPMPIEDEMQSVHSIIKNHQTKIKNEDG